jgi:hypothetical protein
MHTRDVTGETREAVSFAGCFNLLPPNAHQRSHRMLMSGISRSFRHAELHRDRMD